jgi:hypothetical protein
MKQVSKLLLSLALVGLSVPAMADSFWNHNGSVMRLSGEGTDRDFTYETPSAKMRQTGVTSGTLLFNGTNQNGRYSGTAYVFSKYCGEPLPYDVSGSVKDNGTKIEMTGKREIFAKGCIATGRYTTDKLIFTYIRTE